MGDHLSNLVARSLNPAEVVQPRPVSLFEPLPAGGWPALVHPSGLGVVGGESVSGETVSDTPPTTRPAAPPSPVTGLRPSPAPGRQQPDRLPDILGWRSGRARDPSPPPSPVAAQPDERGPQSSVSRAGPDVAQSTSVFSAPQGAILPPVQQASQAGKSRPAPPPAHPEPGAVQPVPPPATVSGGTDARAPRSVIEERRRPALEPVIREAVTGGAGSPAPPPGAARATTEGPPPRTGAEQESRGALEPTCPRPEPPPLPVTSTPVVARPRVTTARHVEPAAPTSTGPPATPQPEPTIHVTIGRVEVRAITPVPRVPRRQPAKTGPALSLHDYLKQRSEGGR